MSPTPPTPTTPADPAGRESTPGDPPPPRASILLVDDHPPNLVALAAILEPLGEDIVTATSGAEALSRLLDREFAVILMDVQMPGMDGLETVALIKQRKRTRDVPIIFLTALSRDAANIFKGYEHGAVDYLLKPFEPSILRSKVAVFVELYRQRELIKRQQERLRAAEREALERKSEARFRSLTDAMPECVLAARPDGAVYYCNAHFTEYTGLALAQCAAHGLLAAVHPEDRAKVQGAHEAALRTDRSQALEYRLRRGDGEYRWHLGRVVAERDERGEVTGRITTAIDVDEQWRLQEAMARGLERERAARAEAESARAEAEVAREAAETASRAKDEFLATVSHELRTPLNAILGWTRMLQSGKLEPARLPGVLATIERNARVQTQLIEDLLDVSRIITGKLRLEVRPVDLPAIAEAAVDAVRPAADAKDIAIDVQIEPLATGVNGDADRLQQVVWNLLANAIKFTPREGRVALRVARVDSQIEIRVSDTGQGIRADFLPFVFDRFRQADGATTRAHGGLGLGLAIVRHLVELHGGTVAVASPGPDQGAVFTVRLPLRAVQLDPADPHALPPAARGSSRAPASGELPTLDGVRVLVVDDEPDARDLVATVLEHYGARVQSVASADEAVTALEAFAPDVLVSDIGMPGEDGHSLIRRVRDSDPRRAIPAAALTAYARADDARRALSAGFDVHMAKPVEPAELVNTVAALVKRGGGGETREPTN